MTEFWAFQGATTWMTGKTACWSWERLEFSIRRTFPDNSGHSAPASDSRSARVPGRWDRWGLARFLVIRRCVASVAWLDFVCVLRQTSGDKLRYGRREVVPGRCHGREVVRGLGSGKCQMGGGGDGFNAENAESAKGLVTVRRGRRRAIAFSIWTSFQRKVRRELRRGPGPFHS